MSEDVQLAEASVRVIDQEAREHRLQGRTGSSLMQILKSTDDFVEAQCGGHCVCGTCHVYVAAEWLDRLTPASQDELELLESSLHRQPNSRLSCQIRFERQLQGITVTIAPRE